MSSRKEKRRMKKEKQKNNEELHLKLVQLFNMLCTDSLQTRIRTAWRILFGRVIK